MFADGYPHAPAVRERKLKIVPGAVVIESPRLTRSEDVITCANRIDSHQEAKMEPSRKSQKVARLLAGVALLLGAGFLGYEKYFAPKSEWAVVGGAVYRLKAPISGTLVMRDVKPGELLAADVDVGGVDQQRLDTTIRSSLAVQLSGDLATIDPLKERIRALKQRESSLRARAREVATSRTASLSLRLDEARAGLAAARAKVEQSESALRRAEMGAKAGVVSDEKVQEQVFAHKADLAGLKQAEAECERLQLALSQAADGMATGETPPDELRFLLRAEELALLVIDLESRLAALQANREISEQELTAVESDISRRSNARLVIPSRSRVWDVAGFPSQHVNIGDTILESVLCDRLQVIAAVRASHIEDLPLGTHADMEIGGRHFDGELRMFLGGELPKSWGSSLLAPGLSAYLNASLVDQRPAVAVVVELSDASMAEMQKHFPCEIGRPVHVRFQPGRRSRQSAGVPIPRLGATLSGLVASFTKQLGILN